jgi:hypothetical protein
MIYSTELTDVAVTLLIFIREVLGSKLGRDIGYSVLSFSWCSSAPLGKCRNSTWIRSRPPPFKSFPNYSPLVRQ